MGRLCSVIAAVGKPFLTAEHRPVVVSRNGLIASMEVDSEHIREFRLHFEGPQTREHTLVASALVAALQQFQRFVHLLALSVEGREVRQRVRITRNIEQKFPLVCGVPEDGGYVLPLKLGDTTHQLFGEIQIDELATQAFSVLEAIDSADGPGLYKLIPNDYYRRNVLAAFKAMQPPPRSGLIVSIEDFRKKKILDGQTAGTKIARLLDRPAVIDAATPSYITGSLIEMKFNQRRLMLQLLGTGRGLEATYAEDFEATLLDRARELIQVHGNVVLSEDGNPLSISDVDEILDIDESPIALSEFSVGSQMIKAHEPIIFSVTFDQDAQIYLSEGPFGILLSAITRPELEDQLDAELRMLWWEYAEADPDTLTGAAQKLRETLREALMAVPYAP